MNDFVRILFFGDIVGPLGRKAIRKYLSLHKEKDKIDFVIANGENTTHGHGLSYEHYKELLSYGVDCLTSGNHFFNSPDHAKYAKEMDKAIRPYNFDKDCPGKGYETFLLNDSTKIKVTNMMGRIYMNGVQTNPFYDMDEILSKDEKVIHILDFHAEATAEKRIMAEYLDGRITAVFGTHTHVQTNDAKILPKGTLFLTDAGMNGAYYSSLGDDIQPAMHRTITGMPASLSVPRSGKILVNAIEFDVDKTTCQVRNFRLINETYQDDPN
jgi:2',3'-cyclic-nucleotide 2'-phosphodiesterase